MSIFCNTDNCHRTPIITVNNKYFYCTNCYNKRKYISLYKKSYYKKNMESIKEKAKLQNVKTRENLRSIREKYKYL